MKKVQKYAGFWIRILSILIDIIIFSVIAISLSLIAIEKQNNKFQIIYWGYYTWMILLIVLITILFILLPILLKGRTIGMFSCQIIVISLEGLPVWLTVLKRNKFYSFLWIFTILTSMSLISPLLAQKMVDVSNDTSNAIELNTLELVLLAIPTTTSGIVIFLNIFMTLSINMSKDMMGINDKFTNTKVVYKNKYIEAFDEENKIVLREKIKNENIIWKE